MELLAVPFTPNHAEYIFLMGRNVLVDQAPHQVVEGMLPRCAQVGCSRQGRDHGRTVVGFRERLDYLSGVSPGSGRGSISSNA